MQGLFATDLSTHRCRAHNCFAAEGSLHDDITRVGRPKTDVRFVFILRSSSHTTKVFIYIYTYRYNICTYS